MKKWNLINPSKDFKHADEIISEILITRGISKRDIKSFLNPDLTKVTISTLEIDKNQIKKAVTRIKKAIKNGEKIIIFGDYDTDGICSTAILWETIYSHYKNVLPYIPHRINEGYGLSVEAIDNLKKENPDVSLIITIDNGIVANNPVEYANKNNIDVIITDHHTRGDKDPEAYAIVHTTKVCAASIAWILAKELDFEEAKNLNNNHLELVALATVSDMVPLLEHNRTLLKFGLETLKKTQRLGVLQLLSDSKINKEELTTYHIGHILAPRINSTGRLSHALDSLRLLCTKDRKKAKQFALELGIKNRERQVMTESFVINAKTLVDKNALPNLLFIQNEKYEQGVIGLVASKLVEEFYRPAIVVAVGEKFSKGSVRSVSGVNIIEMIRLLSSDLVELGGHPMAAGFTIESKKIDLFKIKILKLAKKSITQDLLIKNINIDISLEFDDIVYDLYKKIQQLAPFGIGNPEPVFLTKKVTVDGLKFVGNGQKHLKIVLSQENIIIEGIAFGVGENAKNLHIGDKIDIVYTVDLNVWNGNQKLQLKIKDFANS